MQLRKKIFKELPQAFLFKKIAVCFLTLGVMIGPAYAARTVHYKTYHPGTGEITNRFYYSIDSNLSGEYQVHWIIDEDGTKTEEDYILDGQLATLRFRVVNVEDGTDYVGEREDDSIFVRGRFKGEKVERMMAIDERPFYYNPKIGLRAFVLSAEKEKKFWGFQNRELKVYPMKAVREGPERIVVAGQEVEAIQIYWTVDDFRSAFFKRTYWFRASDGLYIKQRSKGGTFREMVSEEGSEDVQ